MPGSKSMRYEGSLAIDALRAAYASGLGVADVIAAVYERIERVRGNPLWIGLVPRDDALERARAVERRARAGDRDAMPLYGIPFAIKDNIDVAGMPTTAACPDFAYVAKESATVVTRLLDAGAIPIGKTNLDQFATGLVGARSPYGACRNTFDPAYVSGGSSSGSALAVALDLVSFALGTDTAGSGRIPAAFNNIVGLKPTPGLVSTTGIVPACRSLDCVSILAVDCADALEVLDVVAGFDPLDPFSRHVEMATGPHDHAPRIAVPQQQQREFFGDAEYAALYEAALARTQDLGARIVEVDFAAFFEARDLLYDGPWLAERVAGLDGFPERNAASLLPVIRTLFDAARRIKGADVFRALHRLAALRRQTEGVWASADALLVPSAPTIYRVDAVEASPIELNTRLGTYTNFVNLLGLAAIAVPAGFRGDGLPFGVTLIGPAATDRALAMLGGRLHAALDRGVGAGGHRKPRSPDAVREDAAGWIEIVVVGAHLSGLPLNGQLTSRGAQFVRAVRTRAAYRLYALGGDGVPRPGLVRVHEGIEGAGIDAEIWRMPIAGFGGFVQEVAPPLAIGTVFLDDASAVKGFICEAAAVSSAMDITRFGGWRNYLAQRHAGAPT